MSTGLVGRQVSLLSMFLCGFCGSMGERQKILDISALYLRNKILKVHILYTIYNVENQRIAINYTTFPACMLPNLD